VVCSVARRAPELRRVRKRNKNKKKTKRKKEKKETEKTPSRKKFTKAPEGECPGEVTGDKKH